MLESLINNAAALHSCNFIKETPTQVFEDRRLNTGRSAKGAAHFSFRRAL